MGKLPIGLARRPRPGSGPFQFSTARKQARCTADRRLKPGRSRRLFAAKSGSLLSHTAFLRGREDRCSARGEEAPDLLHVHIRKGAAANQGAPSRRGIAVGHGAVENGRMRLFRLPGGLGSFAPVAVLIEDRPAAARAVRTRHTSRPCTSLQAHRGFRSAKIDVDQPETARQSRKGASQYVQKLLFFFFFFFSFWRAFSRTASYPPRACWPRPVSTGLDTGDKVMGRLCPQLRHS